MPNVDLALYDKNADFGGTWFENRYLGCACDIPAHCYQYSFEPNPNWSSFYAPAKEIAAYYKNVALKYGVDKVTHFSRRVAGLHWDEDAGLWNVAVQSSVEPGTPKHETAHVVIQAVGGLNNWKWPDVKVSPVRFGGGVCFAIHKLADDDLPKGRESFRGNMVHSAAWDEAYDYSNKRVALIGTGSTAIQILPNLAAVAAHVDQYVRGPTWIGFPFLEEEMPRDEKFDGSNYHYTDEEKHNFASKTVASYEYRHRLMAGLNSVHPVTFKNTPMQESARTAMEKSMAAKLAERPDIAKFLTPSFPVCCRRLTPGPGYLEGLLKDNVGFVTDRVTAFDEDGIRDGSGTRRSYDAIVCATGFDTTYRPRFPVVGRNNEDLRDRWADFPDTYCSLAVDGFPNIFMVNGPNSAVGSGDLVILFQAQVDYALQCIDKLASQSYKSMDVKRSAVDDYQAYAQTYFKNTVFGTECRTWYKGGRSTGPITALWPGSSLHALETLAAPRWEDYTFDALPEANANRFYYLGTGCVEADDPVSMHDRAWYVTREPHPEAVATMGQCAASRLVRCLESEEHLNEGP